MTAYVEPLYVEPLYTDTEPLVSASVLVTDTDDSLSAVGGSAANATVAVTEAADTLAATVSALLPTASAAIIEADDTLAVLGSVLVLASGVINEGPDLLVTGSEEIPQRYGSGKHVDPDLVREQWDLLEQRLKNQQVIEIPPPSLPMLDPVKTPASKRTPVKSVPMPETPVMADVSEEEEILQVALAVWDLLG